MTLSLPGSVVPASNSVVPSAVVPFFRPLRMYCVMYSNTVKRQVVLCIESNKIHVCLSSATSVTNKGPSHASYTH